LAGVPGDASGRGGRLPSSGATMIPAPGNSDALPVVVAEAGAAGGTRGFAAPAELPSGRWWPVPVAAPVPCAQTVAANAKADAAMATSLVSMTASST